MPEWSRVVNTTIAEYVRQEEVNILRNRKLLALLKERGRISFNHAGTLVDRKVRYKRAPMVGYADGDTLTFSRRDRWKTTQLDWRGYSVTDAMTKKERLMNKGTEAIINIYSDVAKALMDDIDDQFGDEVYIDGNATGNSKRIHGVESFFGAGAAVTNGYVLGPSDSYAGLNTDLGYYGGSWSTVSSNVDWPSGTGDAHYDFFSPLIVSYTNASFTASSDTWANNAVEALRFGIIKSKKNKTKKGQIDLVILNDELYRLFLGAYDSRQNLFVNRNEKGGMYALGFTDVTNFDGVDVTYEYGIPSGVGYGFNVDYIELMSLQPQLFVTTGPDFYLPTQSYQTMVDFYGNMWFNPRYQFKLLAGG